MAGNSCFVASKKVPFFATLRPQTSKHFADFLVYNKYEEDDDKNVKLRTIRVLIPGLASFKSLKSLLDMSSLKPFQKESLRSSIDANWGSWASRKFLAQLFIYLFWLLCMLAISAMRKLAKEREERYILLAMAYCGWIYFLKLEIQQNIQQEFMLYLKDFSNVIQSITLILSCLFLCMDLMIPQNEAVAILSALAQLFGWLNLCYYARGRKEWAWIIYALIVVIQKMVRFMLVLLVAVFACHQQRNKAHVYHVQVYQFG